MWLDELFLKYSYKLSSAEEDAAISNIQSISNFDCARKTFGPHCRNTFLINRRGLRTPGTAIIEHEAEKAPSAAHLLVTAAQLQQTEVCDGTKTVLLLAGELLRQAENLLIMGLHPSEIRSGYEMACLKALDELETLSITTLPTPLTLPTLTDALKPTLATKQFGSENILAALVAEAALSVMPTREKGFCVDDIRVVKIVGCNLSGSKVVRGMVFGWDSDGTIQHATAAKVAVFTCALDIAQTDTVLIKNVDKTTRGKEEHLAKIIKDIAASGIKVIIASSSVSDLALQYLNSHSIAVLKVPSKFELRRVCRVVNATPVERIGTPTPEEVGWVDVYETVDFDGHRVTVLRQLVERRLF
ncbi:hypothetical protein PILCRDRAFT_823711 [Piloderma croceum F 1598]|uniref:Uncharacterized protein n=1 Tax=Piloderma croceum (strain F 1598) TaxID=765440 RepID=A0A0C3BPC8_PILCF|nr:hypothetical protein PILCRDRAFT_823711 [Piloderma croceum F 1598]